MSTYFKKIIYKFSVQMLNGYWTLVAPKYNSVRAIKLNEFTLNKLNILN